MPYPLQCKCLGDMLLDAGRASMAIHYYKEALRPQTLGRADTGAACHNMAIAKSRLFRFEDAKIDFVKAYQHRGDEESLFYYYCLTAFTEGLERARAEMESFKVSELSMESFENRFAGIADAYACSGQAEKQKKIVCLLRRERPEEAEKMYGKMMRELQKNFRPEMETEEGLLRGGLPARPNAQG